MILAVRRVLEIHGPLRLIVAGLAWERSGILDQRADGHLQRANRAAVFRSASGVVGYFMVLLTPGNPARVDTAEAENSLF